MEKVGEATTTADKLKARIMISRMSSEPAPHTTCSGVTPSAAATVLRVSS